MELAAATHCIYSILSIGLCARLTYSLRAVFNFFSCTSDTEILDLTLGEKFFDNCTQFDQTEIEKVQLEAGRIVSGTTKLVSLASLYNDWDGKSLALDEENINLLYKIINRL